MLVCEPRTLAFPGPVLSCCKLISFTQAALNLSLCPLVEDRRCFLNGFHSAPSSGGPCFMGVHLLPELMALHPHIPHSALLASPHPTCMSFSGQPPLGALSGHLLHPVYSLHPSRTTPSSLFLLPCSPLGPTFCAHPFLQSGSEHADVRQAEGSRNGASVT